MRQLHILALQLRTYYTLYTPSSGPRLMRFILIASRCVRALHRQCTNSMNKRRPKVESLVNGRSPPVAAQLFENINIYIICKLSWDLCWTALCISNSLPSMRACIRRSLNRWWSQVHTHNHKIQLISIIFNFFPSFRVSPYSQSASFRHTNYFCCSRASKLIAIFYFSY